MGSNSHRGFVKDNTGSSLHASLIRPCRVLYAAHGVPPCLWAVLDGVDCAPSRLCRRADCGWRTFDGELRACDLPPNTLLSAELLAILVELSLLFSFCLGRQLRKLWLCGLDQLSYSIGGSE